MKNQASPDPGDRGLTRSPDPERLPSSANGVPGRLAGARVLLASLVLSAAGAAGCADSTFEVGEELSIQLGAPASSPVADSVEVTYEARGRSLFGMVLEFGDGAVDTLNFEGAQSAGGLAKHKYQGAGQYQIVGTVTDGIEDTETTQISVTITP